MLTNYNQLPSFIVMGAMKSGTSSLYYYLNEHPAISMSLKKEVNFFLDRHFDKGISWYKNYFAINPDLVKGEVSPSYTKCHLFPGIAERIHAVVPNIKLIYLLRDPVERLRSHMLHDLHHGKKLRKIHSKKELELAEKEMIENIEDSHYLLTSKYFFQLKQYFDFFKKEQFLIITTEQLEASPQTTLSKVFSFIGVDPSYSSSVFQKKQHISSEKRKFNRLGKFIMNNTALTYFQQRLKHLLPSSYYNKFAQTASFTLSKPSLSSSLKTFLVKSLEDDVAQLKSFADYDFEEWKSFRL